MYPEEVMIVKWLAVMFAGLAILRVTRVLAYSVLAPWAEKRAALKAALAAAKVADKAELKRRRIERRDARRQDAKARKATIAKWRTKANTRCARLVDWLIQAFARIGERIVTATTAWRKRRNERKTTPVADYFVARPATREDRRAGRIARRKRAERRPTDDVSRCRIGRFATTTYKVEGEDATLCFDTRSLERFWLPGRPDDDPQLAGFLEGRKALPAPAN